MSTTRSVSPKLVASQECIERSHVGILASAISGYARHLGKIAERTARPSSAHVGAIGERIDLAVSRTYEIVSFSCCARTRPTL